MRNCGDPFTIGYLRSAAVLGVIGYPVQSFYSLVFPDRFVVQCRYEKNGSYFERHIDRAVVGHLVRIAEFGRRGAFSCASARRTGGDVSRDDRSVSSRQRLFFAWRICSYLEPNGERARRSFSYVRTFLAILHFRSFLHLHGGALSAYRSHSLDKSPPCRARQEHGRYLIRAQRAVVCRFLRGVISDPICSELKKN